MGRRERLASIRKKMETVEYTRYLDLMRKAKKNKWKFKEGADVIFSKKDFDIEAATFMGLASELGEPIEKVIFGEQLATSNDSIDQAVMLWNQWPELIQIERNMTAAKFRGNEAYYFRKLREMYGNDEAYDLAMSY